MDSIYQPLHMLYPTFSLIEGRGIIPDIRLPANFRKLVPDFYMQERKRKVEEYTQKLRALIKESSLDARIQLAWNESLGLTNIYLGGSAGLDLNTSGWPSFQEHNMGAHYSYIGAIIATKYISELIKSAPQEIKTQV